MKIRAKIALCTPEGTMSRAAEFDTTPEQAHRWIEQGKAEPVDDPAPAKKAQGKKPRNKTKPPVVAPPAVEPPAQNLIETPVVKTETSDG